MMRYFVLIFVLLFVSVLNAQKVKVLDKETGKIVKNVSIFNEENTISLTTNNKGIVDISLMSEDEIIYFSHISYTVYITKKSTLRNQNFIVNLTKETEELDEVVISVFKKAEKAKRIAEQIAVLSKKEIQKAVENGFI